MENLKDLFNLSTDDLVKKEESSGTNLFKPYADRGKDGVYSAVVRFVPWVKSPKKSIMDKWTCWLEDPLTDKGKYIDCPSSVGKKSILSDMYWKLKKSDSVAEQDLADNFSRRRTFASLIQIIKDKNNPDNEGKIMIWSYGIKVHDKIMEIMEPEFGEPHVPFDLFEGRPFHVKVKKVSGYNNYDSCKFLDTPQPILLDDGKTVEQDEEGMKTIYKYLENNSPDLSKYDYMEWDEDTTSYVHNVIANTVPGGRKIAEVAQQNSTQTNENQKTPEVVNDPMGSTETETKSDELPNLEDELDDDDFDMDDGDFDDDDLYSGL